MAWAGGGVPGVISAACFSAACSCAHMRSTQLAHSTHTARSTRPCMHWAQVGSFPNWDIWAEWNGKYRDDVRRFIKGDMGACVLCAQVHACVSASARVCAVRARGTFHHH